MLAIKEEALQMQAAVSTATFICCWASYGYKTGFASSRSLHSARQVFFLKTPPTTKLAPASGPSPHYSASKPANLYLPATAS